MEQHEIEGTECPKCAFGNLYFVRTIHAYDVANGDALPPLKMFKCDFCEAEFTVKPQKQDDGIKQLAKTMVEHGHR